MLQVILSLFVVVSWPQTPAANMGRQWVEAFASEPAMRTFLLNNITEDGLRERTVDERLVTYRTSKKKFETLRLAKITSSTPNVLKATLQSKNGDKHEFTFVVQSKPPHKLVSVSRVEKGTHGHGFGWLPGH